MSKGNILYIEDSKTQGTITKQFLENSEYEVTWLTEGSSVLQMATTQPFDVILLDRVLPDMDGSEICRQLKHSQDTKGIPVIMLSAKSTTAEKVQGLDAGADDYLPKPYDETELIARIYAALRTKRLQDELRRKNDEMKDMLTKVEVLSVTDALTGLFNRRRFEGDLESEFNKADRYKMPLSCIMIDIDHFKAVNDTYGHAVGDTVIKDIGRIIQEKTRNVDTACRWGGDEFIILAPMTTKSNAIPPARRILQTVSDHAFAGINDKKVTVSIGIADLSGPAVDTAAKLIQEADMALYEAKKNGRNRIELAP
jgi:two-component system cell cycle response regulator